MIRQIGILLLVLGILALVYSGFKYTKKEKVVDLGPIEINADKQKTVSWPPILGVVLTIAGVVLIVTGKKNL